MMELGEIGKKPIREDSPSGDDIRVDQEYGDLQTELDRASSPSAPGTINWDNVIRIASNIIENRSKDLLVASYLSVALLHRDGVGGLLPGLSIMRDVITGFWDTLYPPKNRIRGRRNAIGWWHDKTVEMLGSLNVEPIKKEMAEAIVNVFAEIDNALAEKDEDGPQIFKLREILNRLPVAEEKPAEAPAINEPQVSAPATTESHQAEPPAPRYSPPPAPSAPAVNPGSAQEAEGLFHENLNGIRHAASFMLDQDISSVLPYRLSRFAEWSVVTVLPPASGGKTKIPPPPTQTRNTLVMLCDNKDWANLVKNAESLLQQYIFWFDLGRYASQGLEALGAAHNLARQEICDQTALFIKRLSGVETFTFSDGTPFADGETQSWIARISFSGEPSPAPVSGMEDGGENGFSKTLGQAEALVKAGKLVEAADTLQQVMRTGDSSRNRLVACIGLCEIMNRFKRSKMVIPHLERIIEDIDKYSLEVWEPQLALRGIKAVYTGFMASDDPELKLKAKDIWGRIALLDLGEALRVSGE